MRKWPRYKRKAVRSRHLRSDGNPTEISGSSNARPPQAAGPAAPRPRPSRTPRPPPPPAQAVTAMPARRRACCSPPQAPAWSATPSRPSAERGGLDGVRRRLPETSASMVICAAGLSPVRGLPHRKRPHYCLLTPSPSCAAGSLASARSPRTARIPQARRLLCSSTGQRCCLAHAHSLHYSVKRCPKFRLADEWFTRNSEQANGVLFRR